MIRNIIYKSINEVLKYFLYKALPPGTQRKRKDGIYEKQSNGKWLKITEKKPDKKEDISSERENKATEEINSNKYNKQIDEYTQIQTKKINQIKDETNQYMELLNNNIPGITDRIKEKGIKHFDKIISNILEKLPKDHELYAFAEEYAYASPLKSKIIENIFLDKPLPKITIGWRYGGIPEGGQSYNFKDQFLEPGISMMQTKGNKKNKGFAGLEHKERGTDITIMIGFESDEKGSDGEPIFLDPQIVNRIKQK